MKIDRSTIRSCSSELTPKCSEFLSVLSSMKDHETLVEQLRLISEWDPSFGKTELSRWADVLDVCDEILEAAAVQKEGSWVLAVDADATLRDRAIVVLRFTSLLFENTFTRSMYSSADRVLALLDCDDMVLLVQVLRLLHVMSKRSRFLSQKLSQAESERLSTRISDIAQGWGVKFHNLKLEDCCGRDVRINALIPYQTTTGTKTIQAIDSSIGAGEEMDKLLVGEVMDDKQAASLFWRLRLAHAFEDYANRQQAVVARLLAISILVYGRFLHEEWQVNAIIYSGLVEEMVAVLQLEATDAHLDAVQTETLRTLNAIVFLDRAPKLQVVVDALGASSYHGFIARVTRTCVESLRNGHLGTPGHASVAFCTALFSLLYHLANYDNGGEALGACALTETLLNVLQCESLPLEHISFVTRSVRVIDMITSLDVVGFHACNGMTVTINRLVFEIDECRKVRPFEASGADGGEEEMACNSQSMVEEVGERERCHQQRAALIKSLLNFIKRAIQDTQFADSVRHIMDGALPSALKHIISNPEFYGASLFHNAINVATNFVYQEPSQLTALQDKGLTAVIMDSLLRREIPVSRELLIGVPTALTALCLNERGLQALLRYEPFDHILSMLSSVKYLPAMKRKRNEINETAVALGSSLDDFIRHQPTLRSHLHKSLVKLLDRLIEYGTSDEFECVMTFSHHRSASSTVASTTGDASGGGGGAQIEQGPGSGMPLADEEENAMRTANDSSDEDDEDSRPGEEASVAAGDVAIDGVEQSAVASGSSRTSMEASASAVGAVVPESGRRPLIPLGDFMQNTCRLLETVLSAVAPGEQAEGFVVAGGGDRLLTLLRLPNMPPEVAASPIPTAICNILRFVLSVLRHLCESLQQQKRDDNLVNRAMQAMFQQAKDLQRLFGENLGDQSALMRSASPELLQSIVHVQTHAMMLTQLSRTALASNMELRTLVLKRWTDEELGVPLINTLHGLYRCLVWENAIMLAVSKRLTTTNSPESSTTTPSPLSADQRAIQSATSRVCKALSELFMMLAKICLGGAAATRPRRAHPLNDAASAPCATALQLADALFVGCRDALRWRPNSAAPNHLSYSYLVCVMNFLGPLLFDDRRQPYLVMLSKFYYTGCHQTFFNSFVEQLTTEITTSSNSDGVDQVLEAWLALSERLLNAKALRSSRHKIAESCSEASKFSVDKYLIVCQRDAFHQLNAILDLVGRRGNVRVAEQAIAVYKEIISGILGSSDNVAENAAGAQSSTRSLAENRQQLEQQLDPASITRLVDMGFDREAVIDALIECASVQEATEHLLTTAAGGRATALAAVLSEAEQMERAIAMSLQEDGITLIQMQNDAPDEQAAGNDEMTDMTGSSSLSTTEEAMPAGRIDDATSKELETVVPLNEVSAIDRQTVVRRSCDFVVPFCTSQMEKNPDLVFCTAELITALLEHADESWKRQVLTKNLLVNDLLDLMERVRHGQTAAVSSLATRLHLCCLLWHQLGEPLLVAAVNEEVHLALIRLLGFVVDNPAMEQVMSLIAPIALWLDLMSKVALLVDRRAKFEELVEVDACTWHYWEDDDRGGNGVGVHWRKYSPSVSLSILQAFKSGRSTITVEISGRQYLINFTEMTQRSVETETERPITLMCRTKQGVDVDAIIQAGPASEPLWQLSTISVTELISLLVRLMRQELAANALHAVLSLLVRLTRHSSLAEHFVHECGLEAVLDMKSCTLPASSVLIPLLVRNCVEVDETSLAALFEKAIRGVAAAPVPPPITSRWHQRTPRPVRDVNYMLRALAPLAARNLPLFVSTMLRITRLNDGQLTVLPATADPTSSSVISRALERIVHLLVGRCSATDWNSSERLMSRSALLRLLAELVRSYAPAALMLCEMRDADPSCSALLVLLDRHVAPPPPPAVIPGLQEGVAPPPPPEDCSNSMRSLVATIAAATHSPKAQEILVCDVKTALRRAYNSSPVGELPARISAFASLLLLMRDACPTTNAGEGNVILRLLHKKRLCVDLARAPWYLKLSERDSIDAINNVLKTLEELTRTMNSLLGTAPAAAAVATAASASANVVVATSSASAASVEANIARQNPGLVGVEPIDEPMQQHSDASPVDSNAPMEEQHGLNQQVEHAVVTVDVPHQLAMEEDGSSSGDEHDEDDDDDEDDDGDGGGGDVDRSSSEDDEDEISDADSQHSLQDHHPPPPPHVGGGVHDDHPHHNEEVGDGRSDEEDEYVMEEDEDDEDARIDDDHLETGDDGSFVGANVLLEHLDDFDRMPGGNNARLFVQTDPGGSGGLFGDFVMRSAQTAASAASAAEHPLMTRPPLTSNAGLATNAVTPAATAQSRGDFVAGVATVPGGGRLIMTTNRPGDLMGGNYRLLVGTAAGHGGSRHHRILGGLHRQGAVRRWHQLGVDHNDILQRILESASHQHLFDMPGRFRHAEFAEESNGREDTADDRRRITASVATPMNRLTELARIVDHLSLVFVMMIASSNIRHHLEILEAEQKAKATEERKRIEDEERQRVAAEAAEARAKEVVPPVGERGAVGDANGEIAVIDSDSPQSAAVAAEAATASEGQHEEAGFSNGPIFDVAVVLERMDTSTNPVDAAGDGEEGEPRAAIAANGSRAEDDTQISADARSGSEENAGGVSETATIEEDVVAAANNEDEPADEPMDAQEAPSAERQREIDEYRHILGDIEIPRGVDPAFLAALPADLRAEVIRDHQRQQRAERLRAAQPGSSAAAATSTAAAPGPSSAGLDPEFLSALPTELQEELLAQHERAQRLEAAAAAGGAGPGASGADDAAALIESLPPGLRAQVLADADDTVLQVLPVAVVAEARRLRATFEQQMMRFAGMLGGPGRRRQFAAQRAAAVGALAGQANQASTSGVQLLDKDSIVTLLMLFMVDGSRLHAARLQKVLRSACSHAPTCDFVIWALLAMLDRLNSNSPLDDQPLVSGGCGWLDQIMVATGLGQSERVLKVTKNGKHVSIHPMVAAPIFRQLLDMLVSLAKTFPGQFLPNAVRANSVAKSSDETAPDYASFWHMVFRLNNNRESCPGSVRGRSWQGSGTSDAGGSSLSNEFSCTTMEASPLAQLMGHLDRAVLQANGSLQDRLLRLLSQIVMTLPNDTLRLLSGGEERASEAAVSSLSKQMELVVLLMTEGQCSDEGLNDGRILLMEIARAMAPSAAPHVFRLLLSASERLGHRLQPQIEQLLRELGPCTGESTLTNNDVTPSTSSQLGGGILPVVNAPSSQGQVNAAGCLELQAPAVRMLTDKNSCQHVLLRTLQTVCRLRDSLKSRGASAAGGGGETEETSIFPDRLPQALIGLQPLWAALSDCLSRLGNSSDPHAVLALQPAAEAFFLVHAPAQQQRMPQAAPDSTPSSSSTANAVERSPDTLELIAFAEKHRRVLNQVLRQSNNSLVDGPFAVLAEFPKLLDFDVKRAYFRKELQRMDERMRRDDVAVRVRRSNLFSDSYRELHRLRGSDWKSRFYIMFEGEEGQDAGGLLREWFSVITRDIFNPNYALFITAPGDRVTYMINKASDVNPEHRDYFKFVGRLIAKAIYDNKLLDCYFTRAFYKHILNLPVRYQDMESEDPGYYKSLEFLLEHPIEELGTELNFSLEVEEFGVRSLRQLKPDGAQIPVTDENKEEYVKLVCQMKMTESIRQQLNAFLEGFHDIIPQHLISIFNEQELELLISGLPNIDIDDLANNTDYRSYTRTSPQIQWFWRALRSFEQEDRAKFLQFITGTSKVPLQGFAALEGMNGVQKFSIHVDSRSSDRLPAAHTCFNQLDLPQYESYEKLRMMLLIAVRECTEGFGFA